MRTWIARLLNLVFGPKATVLFVCTGNTCRSPMAAALMQRELGLRYKVESAGVCACPGQPASANAVITMREEGIEISGHCSRQVTQELLSKANYVFCLSQSHLSSLGHTYNQGVAVLGGGINDPFGGSLDTYRECVNQIKKAMKTQVNEIKINVLTDWIPE